MKMTKVQKHRLLNVAVALRDANEIARLKKNFTMNYYVSPTFDPDEPSCGTPACALGHYAARRDLQRAFKLEAGSFKTVAGKYAGRAGVEIEQHFGLTASEAELLFDDHGCNYAHTPIQAARYIEKFVATHE